MTFGPAALMGQDGVTPSNYLAITGFLGDTDPTSSTLSVCHCFLGASYPPEQPIINWPWNEQ